MYGSIRSILSTEERIRLGRYHRKGRSGYDLTAIVGILLLKLFYRQPTMKETRQLLQETGNLKTILGIDTIPSQATLSRLSRVVEQIVVPSKLHERFIGQYNQEMKRVIGHLSADSTIIEAREKPYSKKERAPQVSAEPKKRGRKRKGSQEEQEYHQQQAEELLKSKRILKNRQRSPLQNWSGAVP